jgi:hypothetical protein
LNETRFAPPKAALAEPAAPVAFEPPSDVLFAIKLALAGVLLNVIVLWAGAFSGLHPAAASTLLPHLLPETALMLGLAYGVHRRSRVCAVLLLIDFLLPKIALYVVTGTLVLNNAWLILIGTSLAGVYGAFRHHRLRARAAAAARR